MEEDSGIEMENGKLVPIVGLALHLASAYGRLQWKPPVTAILFITNTLIHRRPGPLDRILPTLRDVGFNCHLIVKYRDLKRFFLSPFYHMTASHLTYNTTALLRMGILLETSMGSEGFASMVAALLCMSQGIHILVRSGLLLLFDYEDSYYYVFSVGFSGVLCGMEVVLNSQSANDLIPVYGVDFPASNVVWIRLIISLLLNPNNSLVGHASGILAGLAYLWLSSSSVGPVDSLTIFSQSLAGIAMLPLSIIRRPFWPLRTRTLGRGSRRVSSFWRCPMCAFDESELANVCGRCSAERDGRGFSAVRSRNYFREVKMGFALLL